jgi:hypothetical protein
MCIIDDTIRSCQEVEVDWFHRFQTLFLSDWSDVVWFPMTMECHPHYRWSTELPFRIRQKPHPTSVIGLLIIKLVPFAFDLYTMEYHFFDWVLTRMLMSELQVSFCFIDIKIVKFSSCLISLIINTLHLIIESNFNGHAHCRLRTWCLRYLLD